MSAPAWVAYYRNYKRRQLFAILAAGELIADKLPKTPNRTSLMPLIFRCGAGALAARYSIADKTPQARRALLTTVGALSALAFSFGGYFLRKAIVNRTTAKDPVVAVIEDGIMLSTGAALKRIAG
jgi:uncharacterized membrane protein